MRSPRARFQYGLPKYNALSSVGHQTAKMGVGVSQRQTEAMRVAAAEDLEVDPPLSESRLIHEFTGGFFVEEWTTPIEGMRYAVPIKIEAQGGQAVEAWLVTARKNRSGERIRRKRPEWLGEERSLVPITPAFRVLTRDLVRHFGGFHAAARAIEDNIARLPAGRHRARYRVTRKQLERIAGKSSRGLAQWRTLDALASIAPQIGVGDFRAWQAAIQSAHINLGLGLYRSWCISQAPGQVMVPLPAAASLLIQRYSKKWLRAGQEHFRVALAIRRSLEPLLVANHAGLGLECSMEELTQDGPFRVINFVRHGLEREDILLRAQKGTGRDRAEARYGGQHGQRAWMEAARRTRREVERRLEELQDLTKYLDFVEKNHP